MQCRLKVGDRVAYSANFLRSIGGDYEMAQGRGIITQIDTLGETFLAHIEWDRELPPRVNVQNICKTRSAAFGDCHTPANNLTQ